MKECPRCHRNYMYNDDAQNTLSRRDDKTYICDACGYAEARIDQGFAPIGELEKQFVKTHPKERDKL